MSDEVFGRIQDDLTVIQRAMGLRLSFGRGMLRYSILLASIAACAMFASPQFDNGWIQVVPLAAILVLVPVGLFLRSRRSIENNHEVHLQVLVSIVIYAVVWIAACGYTLAAFLASSIGTLRTTSLYATSIGLLFLFTLMLVRSAIQSRERYYGLGLALSTLLAGMLFPVIDPHWTYPVAHGLMAVGFLTVAAIQYVQLRDGMANHATD